MPYLPLNLVSYSPHNLQILRLLWIYLNLFAYVPDVYRYGVVADYRIGVPDVSVYIVGRKYSALVSAQQFEYFIFRLRELYVRTVHLDRLGFGIDAKSAYCNNALLFLHTSQIGVPPERGFYARGKLRQIKRLGYIVVRPRRQAEYLVVVLRLCGNHNDRYVFALPYLHKRLHSVHLRHHNVQEHKMNFPLRYRVQGFRAVVRLYDVIPRAFKKNRYAFHNFAVVVHNQNGKFTHTLPSFRKYFTNILLRLSLKIF